MARHPHTVALRVTEDHVYVDGVQIIWRDIKAAAEQEDAFLAEVYRIVLRRAEALLEQQQQARIAGCAGHRAVRTQERPFLCAVGLDENPAAHGGVTYRETCRCGAERSTNVNGLHEEVGAWH